MSASALLLLVFLALLLLAPSAGKPAYEALRLVGHLPCSILNPLRGLPCLARSLSSGVLPLLVLLALLTLLVTFAHVFSSV